MYPPPARCTYHALPLLRPLRPCLPPPPRPPYPHLLHQQLDQAAAYAVAPQHRVHRNVVDGGNLGTRVEGFVCEIRTGTSRGEGIGGVIIGWPRAQAPRGQDTTLRATQEHEHPKAPQRLG